jgi:hypothetical protein
MNFIQTHKLTILGVLIGAVGGYLYYYHIGCVSGTCLITSKPPITAPFTALLWVVYF